MATNRYFEERVVLVWARLNLPGSIAHATMVVKAITSEGWLGLGFRVRVRVYDISPTLQAVGIPLRGSATGRRSK